MEPNPNLLVEQLRAAATNPEAFAAHKDQITTLSRRAAVALESPFETLQRLVYSPFGVITPRVAQDQKIFQTLVDNGDSPTSLDTLSTKTGIKTSLLDPLLTYLATQFMVEQVSTTSYKPTKLTHMLLAPLFTDAITHFHDNCLPAFKAINEKLSAPASDDRTPFQIGQKSSTDFYTWLETRPIQQGAFHRFMEAQFASLPTWLSVISFESSFGQGADASTPVFVDVGGGNGQQCVELKEKHPQLKGRIILQDRPEVLEKAVSGKEVERMPYDYLTEQPVKGARAYYFRQILHNNNDETCLKILKSHLPVVAEGSVLLIDEKVLPDERDANLEGAGLRAGEAYTAGLSIAMYSMFSALERKESEWRALLEKGGFQVREIKRFTDFADSVIVAEKRR